MNLLTTRLMIAVACLIFGETLASSHSLDEHGMSRQEQAEFDDYLKSKAEFGDVTIQTRAVVQTFLTWPTVRPVTICFFNGPTDLRAFFVSVSSIWSESTDLKFDFGAAPNYRKCKSSQPSNIRVMFHAKTDQTSDVEGASFIGTESMKPAHDLSQSSLDIDIDVLPPLGSATRSNLQGTILHEMGHAIGFAHEHQSPNTHCEFDWPTVYQQLSGRYTTDQIDFNFRKLKSGLGEDQLDATSFDPLSIMNYALPKWMFTAGSPANCSVPKNVVLSQIDKQKVQDIYPVAVASDDELLKRTAAQASGKLAELHLDFQQLSIVGTEIGNALAVAKRSGNIHLSRGEATRAANEYFSCSKSVKPNAKVTCLATKDAKALNIIVKP